MYLQASENHLGFTCDTCYLHASQTKPGGTSLQKGNLEPLLGGGGAHPASIGSSGGVWVDRRPNVCLTCPCCGRLHPRKLYFPITPASWEDESNMHVREPTPWPTLQGSGRSGVAASPHAPFLQHVRLIGRIPSPTSPDGPLGPPLRAKVASAPTQNNVPTRPSCMWTLLGIGRGPWWGRTQSAQGRNHSQRWTGMTHTWPPIP